MSRTGAARPGGFSLLELLYVVAITGLLAAVALPTYQGYVARARRVTGRAALMQAAHWLERVATATGEYPATSAIPPGLLKSEGGHYRIAADTRPAAFTLTAEPSGSQAGDRCGTLGLLQTGERKITDAAPDATVDACWNR